GPREPGEGGEVWVGGCFVWPDQAERMARLRAALAIARCDPPEILAGDYVDLLPTLLARRDPEARTVVFQTVSTVYLDAERYAELRRIVEPADAACISTPRFSEGETRLEAALERE